MPRQALMEGFETVLASVRAGEFPYVSRPKAQDPLEQVRLGAGAGVPGGDTAYKGNRGPDINQGHMSS